MCTTHDVYDDVLLDFELPKFYESPPLTMVVVPPSYVTVMVPVVLLAVHKTKLCCRNVDTLPGVL